MEKDLNFNVMTTIRLVVTDAAQHAQFKQDGHALEELLPAKALAFHSFQLGQLSQLKVAFN